MPVLRLLNAKWGECHKLQFGGKVGGWVWGGIAAFGLLGANEFRLHLVSITPPVPPTSSQPNVAMLQWTNSGEKNDNSKKSSISGKRVAQMIVAIFVNRGENQTVSSQWCELHTSPVYFDSLLLLNGLWWLDTVQYDLMWFWCGLTHSPMWPLMWSG